MHRHRRSRVQVIAYAVPQSHNRAVAPWIAATAGLLSSIAIYSIAALLF